MRAVVMSQPGGPEVLELQEIDRPQLVEPNQILVRLMAAGVNPIDTKLRERGLYFSDGLPAVLGCDGSGIIEATGSGVTGFQPGDQVYYCYGGLGKRSGNSSVGNYAEYAVVDEAYVAIKPSGLGFDEAAAAPLVLITAWEALFDRARIQSGQKVFIHAGAGGVGHVAIQLAKIAGCDVATTVSSEEKAVFVRELGADLVINYKNEDVAEALLAWSDGKGVDVAFDTVGGSAFNQLVPAMAHYSDMVTILQLPDDADWKSLRLKNVRVSQELMLSPMVYDLRQAAEHQADILEQCAQFFDENRLSVFVSDVLPLEDAAKAHSMIEAGGTTGKIVLDITGGVSGDAGEASNADL
ncbi:MAG: zinc-dependent alcohol dehydrogenase family protein [Mariprofundaceae bacterium]|nr:zinc-dependent alcohol dehydrogenase family protein [Mariprofundaceae bacterium]